MKEQLLELKGPNEETLRSMNAIRNEQYSKAYDSVAEMFADLDKEIAQEIDRNSC